MAGCFPKGQHGLFDPNWVRPDDPSAP
jgi:hypothetical protein